MIDFNILTKEICSQASSFGFLEAAIARIKIDEQTKAGFMEWLNHKFHGSMEYLAKNTHLRFNPEILHEGTLSIICVKAPYLTKPVHSHKNRLSDINKAYVSSYALGRDYHKVLRKKLKEYSVWITEYLSQYDFKFEYRVFTDSAPILEVELAKNAGLGFRGKNTLLLNKTQGSMFFLGEIFTNVPLIPGKPATSHCGSCTKCIEVCPTRAFVSPYILDAKKCISYLTIENKESIPEEYRKAIGNRIYGCDDCQLFCPWNKFSKLTNISDFNPRKDLEELSLTDAFLIDEKQWQELTIGSPIYRIGYESWLRNVAVALGNASTSPEIMSALRQRQNFPSVMVQEHINWALAQHQTR
ncbi:MAG: queG [Burkholderiales bacterium]|jgi:epoxyqueuosine reductase|nr:queG [Burkholderiales bacterium]